MAEDHDSVIPVQVSIAVNIKYIVVNFTNVFRALIHLPSFIFLFSAATNCQLG